MLITLLHMSPASWGLLFLFIIVGALLRDYNPRP